MGTGKSGIGGGGKQIIKTSVTGQSNESIDLTGIPLVYGKKDAALSQSARKTIEAQELKRLKSKTEYALSVDENGNVIGKEYHGGKGNVNVPHSILVNPNGTFTHNHPRGAKEVGCLGGTFSSADMKTFSNSALKTIRASASEGTYSMTKNKNFDAKAFSTFAISLEKSEVSKYKKSVNQLQSDVRAGKVSFSDYGKSSVKLFNMMLVNIHNAYRDGQKKFGYKYTLEER